MYLSIPCLKTSTNLFDILVGSSLKLYWYKFRVRIIQVQLQIVPEMDLLHCKCVSVSNLSGWYSTQIVPWYCHPNQVLLRVGRACSNRTAYNGRRLGHCSPTTTATCQVIAWYCTALIPVQYQGIQCSLLARYFPQVAAQVNTRSTQGQDKVNLDLVPQRPHSVFQGNVPPCIVLWL